MVMSSLIDISKKLNTIEEKTFDFSICTFVTRKLEYEEMLASFIHKGFTEKTCEYLFIDNSEKCIYEAYGGINIFLQKAKGKYIIICHQDIIIHDNDKSDLLNLIAEVEEKDANWAILSNAGGINLKWIATHITQGNGIVISEKNLPLKVQNVDENFIVVKKSANLSLSTDLKGFHFYGTDICLIADILGYSSYVIGFNLMHKSNGKVDASFFKLKSEIKKKYKTAFRNRFLTTTITQLNLNGNYFFHAFYNSKIILFLVRAYYKFFTKKSDYKLK